MLSRIQCQVSFSVAGAYFCTALSLANIIVLHPAGILARIFLFQNNAQ